MKRSRINEIIREGDAFIRSFGYSLPPFAYWSPDDLKSADHAQIKARRMGWDITDYGAGDYDKMGLFLFTTRNGLSEDLGQRSAMLYAEKIMISKQDQLSPNHHHLLKVEDIINRGGGTLVIEVHNRLEDGSVDRKGDVRLTCDGIDRVLPAGGHLKLDPGESVTLYPHTWHAFWGEGGDVLIGEVSTVNDDTSDNIFEMDIGRFSTIDEDEAPLHLLVSDYDDRL
ncbi:D-lyxose/D-mannose family sugar isomerase [Salipiger sp. 1_MG-2023]|uniref:D-lyxose/D-mannose family sugar isomerase n=1 Tax=Salipiger sp. 1_MG-2023 TaxID=3062665 RepID=UPI0026E2A7AB|nr:D-lyxose/D-mannose family sugar isomerase [Salipiger sp. 1_MG-2023]MDO6584303.1 D-lyxose/D-mannose family sugar isomerase [Salipiger sp. 1_MG-2023]